MQKGIDDDERDREDTDDAGDEGDIRAWRRPAFPLTLSSIFGPRAHVVPLLVRVALGALFLIAGFLKIGHAGELAAAITAYRTGLPPPVVAAIALALPPFEILLGVYLIAGLLLPVSAAVATAQLALFTVVVASAVMRGLSAPCGCFGPGDSQPATWLTVWRDVGLLALAAYLAWWSRARLRVTEPAPSP